jgi:uncharacterized membrane-anchored protein
MDDLHKAPWRDPFAEAVLFDSDAKSILVSTPGLEGFFMLSRWAAAAAAAILVVSGSPRVLAAEPAVAEPPSQAEQGVREAREKVQSIEKRTGVIKLAWPKATLDTGKAYYFLDTKDSAQVLLAWGNPPEAAHVLGMLFPSGVDPMSKEAWGVVIDYLDTGFVTDDDAKTYDYAKLLQDMQSGEAEDNAAREKRGFNTMHLVGWAEPPAYDASHHIFIWAKDLKSGGGDGHTLNYDIRVLGRSGVLMLQAVSSLDDLPAIRQAAESIRQTAQFDVGARYADVDKKSDKMAGYGVAGLIAAGAGAVVAKKVGLLGVILLFGKKFIIFIVAGFAAISGWLKSKLGKRTKAVIPVPDATEGPTPDQSPTEGPTSTNTPPSPPQDDIVS